MGIKHNSSAIFKCNVFGKVYQYFFQFVHCSIVFSGKINNLFTSLFDKNNKTITNVIEHTFTIDVRVTQDAITSEEAYLNIKQFSIYHTFDLLNVVGDG